MTNETLLTVPFAHANIVPAVYNGWIAADAEKDVAHWFNSWYPEFVLVSIDWVQHSIKVKANA